MSKLLRPRCRTPTHTKCFITPVSWVLLNMHRYEMNKDSNAVAFKKLCSTTLYTNSWKIAGKCPPSTHVRLCLFAYCLRCVLIFTCIFHLLCKSVGIVLITCSDESGHGIVVARRGMWFAENSAKTTKCCLFGLLHFKFRFWIIYCMVLYIFFCFRVWWQVPLLIHSKQMDSNGKAVVWAIYSVKSK